jgi:hypothetical protein
VVVGEGREVGVVVESERGEATVAKVKCVDGAKSGGGQGGGLEKGMKRMSAAFKSKTNPKANPDSKLFAAERLAPMEARESLSSSWRILHNAN